jgi:hypothetical protein
MPKRWLDDAAGDVITADLYQKLRADVFWNGDPCTDKGVSDRWVLENRRAGQNSQFLGTSGILLASPLRKRRC